MLLTRQVGGYFHGIPPCLDEYSGMMGLLGGNCKGTYILRGGELTMMGWRSDTNGS
jgi:hypothetical protein